MPAAKTQATPRSPENSKPARKGAPEQTFTVSHLHDKSFRTGGLRKYVEYRDLGMAAATHGLVQAHVTRTRRDVSFAEIGQQTHYHDVQFQMVYILKGWLIAEFEGQGQHRMVEGSCWLQPSKIVHKVVDQSNDLQVLEVVMPANFATVDL